MVRDYTPELAEARAVMGEMLGHIHAFDPAVLTFVPAIIDEATGSTWRSSEPQGLHKFTECIEAHAAQLEALAASGEPPREDPLPVVMGMATSWKAIVPAPGPVPAVRMAVKGVGKAPRDGFIDVVARGGAEWIRIYSKKSTALLAEFREQDSYLTSDSDDDEERAPIPFSNSVTRLVDDLLAIAAQTERIPGAAAPKLTLRLSRIAEFPEGGHLDDRIPQMFAAIRSRGVNLIFGDMSDTPWSELPITPAPPKKLTPSRRLNLDPTALMGLCSDLLHHPLPKDAAGARARFYRPPAVLEEAGHSGGGRGNWADAKEEDAAQSQNSRELVRALIEELDAPLVEVIRDALEAAAAGEEIELWATREAVIYLQETISSEIPVGEGLEQLRMRRLTGLEDGDFWQGSRYEGRAGCLQDIKLHLFDDEGCIEAITASIKAGHDTGASNGVNGGGAKGHTNGSSKKPNSTHSTNGTKSSDPNAVTNGANGASKHLSAVSAYPLCAEGMTSFHESTAAICSTLVREYLTYVSLGPEAARSLPSFLNPRRLPSPRVAQISTPFTVVALHSLGRGAAEGMTTLSMGHVMFRELFAQQRWRVKGWTQGNYDIDDPHAAHAVAWILPYRSLGEGKRVRFAQGDYSFPQFVQRMPRDGEGQAVRAAAGPDRQT